MGHNFKELLSEAHALSPNAQIVGCTCGGIIGKEGPDESMKALAIMVIKGPKNEFAIVGRDSITTYEPDKFGYHIASEMKSLNPDINMILFLPSQIGMIRIGIYDAIKGIESVFGPDIPIFGGLSCDNFKGSNDFQFFNDKIFENGAIMVGFADPDLEVICQADHGFDVIGNPFEVTRSDRNHIFELDRKPARKCWLERLGMAETTPLLAIAPFSPLAAKLDEKFHEEYGNSYIVFLAYYSPDSDGSLYAPIPCPEGSKLWMTRRNEVRIQEGIDKITLKVLERCEGRKPVAIFHSDCAARGKLLFERIVKDEVIGRLQYPFFKDKKIPWLGMYGGGEITPLGGENQIHTYTSSIYAIVKRKPEVKEKKVDLKTEVVKSSMLFKPSTIRNIGLKNRFIVSATWSGNANFNGSCSPILINFVLNTAKGEPGMIISEYAYVSRNGQSAPQQLGIYDDSLLPGLVQYAENVHRYHVPVIMQMVHGGLFSAPLLTGFEPIGPSVLETPNGQVGHEMTHEEIRETVIAFRDGAIRAQKAGFDGVEIHAAHGWLFTQFLSPIFNKRNDEYGGNLENRSRILLEVIKIIREAAGDKFAVLVKINSEDLMDGGFGIDEMIQISAMLEKASVDAIEISGGTIGAALSGDFNNSFVPVKKKGVYYREAAKRFKEKIKIPLILVGGIRTFEEADELVRNGVADYISMCRPLIREPGLIKRWKSGDLGKSECKSDSACLQPGLEGKGVYCVHLKSS